MLWYHLPKGSVTSRVILKGKDCWKVKEKSKKRRQKPKWIIDNMKNHQCGPCAREIISDDYIQWISRWRYFLENKLQFNRGDISVYRKLIISISRIRNKRNYEKFLFAEFELKNYSSPDSIIVKFAKVVLSSANMKDSADAL